MKGCSKLLQAVLMLDVCIVFAGIRILGRDKKMLGLRGGMSGTMKSSNRPAREQNILASLLMRQASSFCTV